MASILRSSKFVRYIAGFTRNLLLNTPREFDGTLVNTSQCLCGAVPRSFASQIPQQHDQSLEHSLRRIDQDVRKSGRISRRDIEDVLEEIRSNRSATSSQSLLVIRCCGNLVPEEMPETRTKLVQEIWSTLNKLNVPMDISHYNALLRVYLENEYEFSPTEFLAELESKGLEPNRVTYQRLIARYCQVGDIEGATKILEFMREKQLPVNENVFNALIVGHSQAGDMDSAQGIIGVMTQAGLEPSADTFTTLLCGYAKKGDIESMQKVFQECDEKDVYLLDKDYLDIIYSLATNDHHQHVPTILTKVRKAMGYNQDAINLILRLINKGMEDTAFLVLQSMVRNTRTDGTIQPTGLFFIKHLVKANRPVEKIVEVCNKMEELGMYERALLLAAETSLQLGNDQIAYPLLRELKNRNVEVRQHYFWPLIVSKGADPTGRDIIEVLIQMNNFNTPPNAETIREYVIPNMKGKSGDIIAALRDANISIGASASSLVQSLLQRHDLEEAAVISGRVKAYYSPEILRRPLTNAFYKTGDLENYIAVVRNIYDNLDRKSTKMDIQESEPVDKNEIIGTIIIDLISNRQFNEVIVDVLEQLKNQGLSISTNAAERIQDKLGEKMTEHVSNLLGKLTSGELTPVPIVKKLPSYTPFHQMNIPQLERLVHNLEAKNQDTKGLKRQLLTLYYREKDVEKAEKLVEDLTCSSDFKFTPGLHAQLADLYAYHNNEEKAMQHYEELKNSQGDAFTMDESKTIQIAHLLTRNNKFDDAIKILETTPRDERENERNFAYSGLVWRFLNYLAEEGRVDDLNKLFNTLLEKSYIEPTNILLGPLIKVHLVNNELDKALEKLEWCVKQYKSTPWKSELACKLIQAEDAEKLQKLTDLGTEVHGEINSLYDLVFAFVECGRIRQARKILETPGLQNRPQRINNACERYQQEGLIKPLEGLKDATRDLNHIDRSDIYYQLLLTYIKQEDVDKALGLWTQMQEEDLLPTDQFMLTLGTFLQQRGMDVPFAIPNMSVSARPPPLPISASTPTLKSPLNLFRHHIKLGDVDGALAIEKKNSTLLTVSDLSLLIEKLTQQDRTLEATQLSLKMIDNNMFPIIRVFKFFLNKLASSGDIEALQQIGAKIDKDMKKSVSFDNKMCHANLIAGKAEDYLLNLEKLIDDAKDSDLAKIGEEFPRGGAYGIIERQPELLDKFESIAIKYVKHGIVAPINVLWTHHFINGNVEKAELLWNEHLKESPRIMFQRIVHAARDTKDETLIKRLIEHLKISKVTEGAVGNAYSCLLDVLVSKQKYDEVINAFEIAINEAGIDHINRTAVLRVQEVYRNLGKPFNYTIPAKNPKNVASSTSDEDIKVKN